MLMSKEDAMSLSIGTILYCRREENSDGTPVQARVTGACTTWRTNTSDFSLPAKKETSLVYSRFYITQRNFQDWTNKWLSGEDALEAARKKVVWHEKRTKAWLKEDIPKYCQTLKKYHLSTEDLHKFGKEVERGSVYTTEKGRLKVSQILEERCLLEEQKIAIINRVERKYLDKINELERERDAADKLYDDVGTFQSLFTNKKKNRLNRYRSAQARYESLFTRVRDEWKQEIEPIESRLNELYEPFIFDSIYHNIRWWEQPHMTVSQKKLTRNGSSEILARACPWNLEALFVAINIVSKETEKKEDLDALKARAASSSEASRKLAISVRKRMANQISVVPVCPYCGKPLDLETAHADHIYPVSKGGHSHIRNMVYVCMSCNLIKKDLTLNQFIRKTGFGRNAIESRLDALKKDY